MHGSERCVQSAADTRLTRLEEWLLLEKQILALVGISEIITGKPPRDHRGPAAVAGA